MSLTVSFDSHIAHRAEEIASKMGMSAPEYITRVVEEAMKMLATTRNVQRS